MRGQAIVAADTMDPSSYIIALEFRTLQSELLPPEQIRHGTHCNRRP